MTRNRPLIHLAGLICGVLLSGRIALLAQNDQVGPKKAARPVVRQEAPAQLQIVPDETRAITAAAFPAAGSLTLQDALLRTYHFPFSKPTPLAQVCAHLKETLKAAVVLDLAALGRQDVEPDDPIQLELARVRLKTGLKLLLDHVGLTYRVLAQDNHTILTDPP